MLQLFSPGSCCGSRWRVLPLPLHREQKEQEKVLPLPIGKPWKRKKSSPWSGCDERCKTAHLSHSCLRCYSPSSLRTKKQASPVPCPKAWVLKPWEPTVHYPKWQCHVQHQGRDQLSLAALGEGSQIRANKGCCAWCFFLASNLQGEDILLPSTTNSDKHG